MKQVTLKPLHHRGQECIGIYFDNSSLLNGIVRIIPKAKWSQSNKCWYVLLNAESYNQLYKALNGKADLDIAELKQFLQKVNIKINMQKTNVQSI